MIKDNSRMNETTVRTGAGPDGVPWWTPDEDLFMISSRDFHREHVPYEWSLMIPDTRAGRPRGRPAHSGT
jgi:hypothetical protein